MGVTLVYDAAVRMIDLGSPATAYLRIHPELSAASNGGNYLAVEGEGRTVRCSATYCGDASLMPNSLTYSFERLARSEGLRAVYVDGTSLWEYTPPEGRERCR